jgi:site-specific recombinase XerD
MARTSDPIESFAGFLAQAERSPLTIKNYRGDLAAFAAWFEEINGEPMAPAKVTPTDLRQFKRSLVEQRRLKPSSVNRKLATLKSFLTWAAAAGIAPGLPVPAQGRSWSGPRLVPQERPGPRWLDRREQNALLRAVERAGKARDLAVVRLLLNTGLRVQELCALMWKDVALSERKGLLTVRHGKGGKHRQVPLNHDARAALTALGYPQHAGEEAVILQGQRGPMTPRGVQALLARYGALAGLDDLSPHALRHTFCKNLIDAGVGLEQVAALAGHESLETTRRYCTPSRLDLERAVERIGEGE